MVVLPLGLLRKPIHEPHRLGKVPEAIAALEGLLHLFPAVGMAHGAELYLCQATRISISFSNQRLFSSQFEGVHEVGGTEAGGAQSLPGLLGGTGGSTGGTGGAVGGGGALSAGAGSS